MSTHPRIPRRLVLCLLAACGVDAGAPPAAPAPGPTPDALAGRPIDAARTAQLLAQAQALVRPGSVMQTEPRLGVPTVVWARETQATAARARSLATTVHPELAAARAALADYAPLYGLASGDVAGAVVASVHDVGAGPVLVKYRAQLGGLEIFREELNVVLTRKLEPIALTGYLTSTTSPPTSAGGLAFRLTAPAAAGIALSQLGATAIDAAAVVAAGPRDGYDRFTVAATAGVALDEPVRIKPVYFHAADGLEAAYYVEVIARTGPAPIDTLSIDGTSLATSEGHAYVVSAATGQILFHKNLSADASAGFTYRVWADPVTGIPLDNPAGNDASPKRVTAPDGVQAPFIAPSDVTLANYPFSQNDPWLAPGATETVGNNADAFLNLFDPDGYGDPTTTVPSDPPTGDFRAQLTGPGQFLHSQLPDVNAGTAEGRQGAIQQLFYNVNYLHDWFYDAGFDEAAGNAQADNYGRGGVANDSMKAQAQDASGYSNANMLTPADGGRPRMRMYTFPSLANKLEVVAPSTIVARSAIGVSMLGAQAYDITAEVGIVSFAPTADCAVLNIADLAGKIAMFDYDKTVVTACTWQKLLTQIATTTTAQATVMVYVASSPTAVSTITGFIPADTEPMLTASWNAAAPIKAQIAAGQPVTVRLLRVADRDGSLDQGVVFHEYFHYVSNRLIGNGAGLANNQGGGMGEGWSDFNAMMLIVRETDTAVASNATFNGVYPMGSYVTSGVPFTGAANQGYYFGIRRYPYSTDMTRNPLTFKHVANGVALPVGPPVAFGNTGSSNAEVHNTGEVWAMMLWECYAGLLRDTLGGSPRLTFHDAQDRMKRYLIAALKITPSSPTILEARDAVLAVAAAGDPADYVAFRTAFAKRGAGAHAIAPDRYASDNAGAVEDFTVGADLQFVAATLDDAAESCDRDGVLDHGEYGRLTVTLQNVGTVALSATTAKLTTTSPGLWYPDGTTLAFPAVAVGGTVSATLRVAYPATVTGIQPLDLQIDYTDAQMTAVQTKIIEFRANTNEVASATATDTVEARASAMTNGFATTAGNVAPWHRIEITGMEHAWHLDNTIAPADQSLISPAFTVAAGGAVSVQFDHTWGFDLLAAAAWHPDGGVVEMSVNAGDYVDIGTPAYNGVITTYATSPNPLKGRSAFIGVSTGKVHTLLTQSVAPGSTVRFRFRFGSDAFALGGAAVGWTIDNLAFAGVVETPFTAVVEDTAACDKVPSTADLAITLSDWVSAVRAGGTVTYAITASNGSAGDVLGAVVTDSFPPALACTWTCVATPGAACAASGSGDLNDRASLPAGGAATYTAVCAVSATSPAVSLSNTARIAPPGPITDSVPANNAATDSDTVIRLPAHLTAGKTVSGSFVRGGTVVYSIVLADDGPGAQFDDAGDELVDVLPDGLTLLGAFATTGATVATPSSHTVTWNGDVAAGGSVTITIVAQITAPTGTTISNQAVFHYDSDGDAINDASGTTDAYVCSATP
jgi:uncharacterized repeat protein (TIGR01451 family)